MTGNTQKIKGDYNKMTNDECIYNINGYCMYFDRVCTNEQTCKNKETLKKDKKENENNDRQTNIK